jgi:uncharacterized protein YbcV (DUF1398 family)
MWNQNLVKEITVKSKAERWPYPKTFEALKEAGVRSYRAEVANHEITYIGDEGTYVEKNHMEKNHFQVSDQFNGEAVKAAIKRHQDNRTPFDNFLREIAKAGVKYYEVDMGARKINYTSGRNGECHAENIPPFN